jgi:hypothetical protein
MYKIRTMRNDAEAATGPVWARAGDPRVTPLGRVLRKLHLDEFPQLFNVLRGEMALIGPRPERPEFSQHLTLKIPHYQERLTVLPGITGLAQINLPPDTDLDSVRRKLTLDLEYIATARFLLDLRMFMCTAVRLVGIHGELAMRMFALKRNVQPSTSEHDVAECNEAPVISTSGPVHGLHSDHKPATVNGESASYSNGNSHNGHTSVGGARPGAVFSGDAAP